jgi:hypothetical protein
VNRHKLHVVRCPDTLIRPTVERDHYLHRWPDPRSLPFGYCLALNGQMHAPDGRPYGLAVMKKPQHHRQQELFGYPWLPTSWQVLDLARVWVHPTLQTRLPNGHARCIFTQMVSRVLKRVQRDWLVHHPPMYPEQPYHILLVISYCEREHHDGTSYRAANFERWGVTSDGTKEIYVRRLAKPRWSWRGTYQPQLLTASPHSKGARYGRYPRFF